MINQLGHPCLLYLVIPFANHYLFEASLRRTQDEAFDIGSGGVGHFKLIAD